MKLKYEITLGKGDKMAIRKSINKWEKVRYLMSISSVTSAIRKGTPAENCALCVKYAIPTGFCQGCPLFEATGLICHPENKSVYGKWYRTPTIKTTDNMIHTLEALLK